MVNIKYIGDVSPCTIKVSGNRMRWVRDEIKNLDKATADKIKENQYFIDVVQTKKVEKKEEEPKFKSSFSNYNKNKMED